MAVKAINPQLEAYYNQLRHPIPDFLSEVSIRNIHDTANMRFNERLWQKVKELNEGGVEPGIHEFRQIAAEIRRQVDVELYECEDPERLSTDEIVTRLIDSQVAVSPVNLGEAPRENSADRRVTTDSETKSRPRPDPVLVVTISINTRGLSRRESGWIEQCFAAYEPDTTGGDHTIALGSSIEVDSLEGVDRWLPRRVKVQLLGHAHGHARDQGMQFKLPLRFRLKSFLSRIF